jgi:hypothetical protein
MGLTKQQLALFTELYLKGHSGTYIFQHLGEPTYNATTRMQYYKRKLKLPSRYMGFQTIEQRRASHQRRITKLQERITNIQNYHIPKCEQQITWYQRQLVTLKQKLSDIPPFNPNTPPSSSSGDI